MFRSYSEIVGGNYIGIIIFKKDLKLTKNKKDVLKQWDEIVKTTSLIFLKINTFILSIKWWW